MRITPSRVLPVILALLLLGSTDGVAAKRCPRLCRSDVKSCSKSCQGTRKQKRACKRGCKSALLQVCRTFSEPACTPPEGPCGPAPITCDLLALLVDGFQPGVSTGLPADFPPPPGNAQLCGQFAVSATQGTVTFVAYTVAPSSDPGPVLTYYANAFSALGFDVASQAPSDQSRVGCDFGIKATRNGQVEDVVVVSPLQGMVTAAHAVAAGGTGGTRPPRR